MTRFAIHRDAPCITCAPGADGTLTYHVPHAVAELPAVRRRDLLAAWDAARDPAQPGALGAAITFRFPDASGGWTVFSLRDLDLVALARGADHVFGLHTAYGLSVCLRLVALVDGLVRRGQGGTVIDAPPAMLRLAAEGRLTDEAGLDAAWPRARPGTPYPACPS